MKTKYIITLMLFGLIFSVVSGCSLLRKRVDKVEKVSYRLSSVNKTKFSVQNNNGDIKITRTDDTLGTITVDAEKRASVKYDDLDKPMEDIKIMIDSSGSEIKIETEISSSHGVFRKGRNGEVNFNIKVPANILVAVDNTNGKITLTKIDNELRIDAVNSTVNLNKCSGNISISGVNGGVFGNFDSTKGLNIDLVNGTVKLGGLRNLSADINASTVNGRVKFNNLSFENLSAERKNLTGRLGKGGNFITISTVSGNITLDADQVTFKKDNDIRIKVDLDGDGDIEFEDGRDVDSRYDGSDRMEKKRDDKNSDAKGLDSNKNNKDTKDSKVTEQPKGSTNTDSSKRR